MSRFLLRPPWRVVVLATAISALLHTSVAQQPSPSLKEADADYTAGTAALSRNDLTTALQDFEKVVRLAPAAEQGHSALGAVLVRLGRVNEGIRELQKALEIKPGEGTALLNLAMAYEQSGEAARALPLFARVDATARAAHRQLPSYVLAAYARALAATQHYPEAVAKMKQAVAADAKDAELQDELGSLYAQYRDWANARLAFTAAVDLNPDFAAAHLHLAIALEAMQQQGALYEFSTAAKLAPQNATIALQFGRALAAAGRDEEATAALRHALELEPTMTAASYQLALVLQRQNELQEAIPLLRKAAGAEPDNAEILTNLGMALSQAQQAKEAVPVLQRAVGLKPENATAHQNLAAAYIQLSQFDDAVTQLRAALKLLPDAPQLHYNLGLAFKMQDDAAHAIPELETAERLDASAPEPPYVLGVLYLQAGRYADAQRELSTSLKLRPENGNGWATLGSVYNNLSRLTEAESALREAVKQLPEQPDPHLTLAAVLAKEGKPAEAAAERKQAAGLMRTNMNRQRAEVASNSGNSLLKSGKIEDAIVEYRSALTFDADYADAHRGLADALQMQGKTDEAAAERQKADALKEAAP